MMNYRTQKHLLCLLEKASPEIPIKSQFVSRIQEGNISRDENPASHICVYFAGYDPKKKRLFMGKHIKSGLWLFNGGHIDINETLEEAIYREMSEEWGMVKNVDINSPSLFTLTHIENPKKQVCKTHYDIWYFIPLNKDEFNPSQKLLRKEFSEWGWKTREETNVLVKNEQTLSGIEKIATHLFV